MESQPAQISTETQKFTIDTFIEELPELRSRIKALQINDPKGLIRSLTDEDYLKLYSEWLYRRADVRDVQGYLVEVMAERFLNPNEKKSDAENIFTDTFFYLTQYQNQVKLWGSNYKSFPDDLIIKQIGPKIEIQNLIEAKSKRGFSRHGQRGSSIQGISSLINALNGEYGEIKTEEGKMILDEARDFLKSSGINWVYLSPKYKFVYMLPIDQHYSPTTERTEVVRIPVSRFAVGAVSEAIHGYFQEKYPLPQEVV